MPGGAPKGNNNAGKAKLWTHAITKALEKRTKREGVEALQAMAEYLLDKIEEGDMTAIKEFGDRIEGKPHQTVTNEGSVIMVDISGSDTKTL